MKKEISFEERKRIQVEMLDEIHTFCISHDIKYSIAFGTLLGAIRHKGFIPWDDDVDIMMPLSDMLRFKKEFKSEKLKYCDVDTEPLFGYPFSRIAYLPTYCKEGLICNTSGICIDLYVVVPLPKDEKSKKEYFELASKKMAYRMKMTKIRRKLISYLPIKTIPGYAKSIKEYRDHILYFSSSENTPETYYVVAGPIRLKDKMTYSFDLFEKLVYVEFEGRKYCATSYYREFLTLRYGDYMQLPPEDKRHPYHGCHYYWK